MKIEIENAEGNSVFKEVHSDNTSFVGDINNPTFTIAGKGGAVRLTLKEAQSINTLLQQYDETVNPFSFVQVRKREEERFKPEHAVDGTPGTGDTPAPVTFSSEEP